MQAVLSRPLPPRWRGQQRIRTQRGIAAQRDVDQHDVAFRIRDDSKAELAASVRMHDLGGRNTGPGQPQPIRIKALDFDPESVAVADDEAEIADLRHVDARMVDLVQDAVADREPHASRRQARSR
jgi:hypothetical protein